MVGGTQTLIDDLKEIKHQIWNQSNKQDFVVILMTMTTFY